MKALYFLFPLFFFLFALGADEKPTLYDRNKRATQSQGQYNRSYDSYNQDRGSQRNYYNSRDYYYDDYYDDSYQGSSQNRAIGRPPTPRP